MSYCSNCGAELGVRARFCRNCGNMVEKQTELLQNNRHQTDNFSHQTTSRDTFPREYSPQEHFQQGHNISPEELRHKSEHSSPSDNMSYSNGYNFQSNLQTGNYEAVGLTTAFRKYATFNGRATRKEYWLFCLFQFIIGFVVFATTLTIEITANKEPLFTFIAFLVLPIIFMLPNLAVLSRRLHDIGNSAWMILLGCIPVIGVTIIFIMTLMPSQPGDNKYGKYTIS